MYGGRGGYRLGNLWVGNACEHELETVCGGGVGWGVEAWVEDGVSMYGFIGSVVRCMGSTWRVRDG